MQKPFLGRICTEKRQQAGFGTQAISLQVPDRDRSLANRLKKSRGKRPQIRNNEGCSQEYKFILKFIANI